MPASSQHKINVQKRLPTFRKMFAHFFVFVIVSFENPKSFTPVVSAAIFLDIELRQYVNIHKGAGEEKKGNGFAPYVFGSKGICTHLFNDKMPKCLHEFPLCEGSCME